jgi:hypothetical protein
MKRRKRFAIVIGVVAAGVMALGAQTGAQVPDVVSYGTKVTIFQDRSAPREILHGEVKSRFRKCRVGRKVIVFKKRPGPDRKLGATRSGPQARSHNWLVHVKGATHGSRVYAKATPMVGDGFVCRPGSSGVHVVI